jgi:hypothetical protein
MVFLTVLDRLKNATEVGKTEEEKESWPGTIGTRTSAGTG